MSRRLMELNVRGAVRERAGEASGVVREQGIARVLVWLALFGLVAAMLSSARGLNVTLARAALVVLLAAFLWVCLGMRRGTLSLRTVRSLLVPVVLSAVLANFALGLVSTFCAGLTLGIVIFSSLVPGREARLAYVLTAAGYAACALWVHCSWAAYTPLFRADLAGRTSHLFGAVLVEFVYFAAFVVGRSLRGEHGCRVLRGALELGGSATGAQAFVATISGDAGLRPLVAQRSASPVLELHKSERRLVEGRAGVREQNQPATKPGRFTGHELDGFLLGDVIGRGGMGEVYAAEDRRCDRSVAVKLLRFETLGEEDARSRFKREAKLVASISSPHVVRILGVSGEGAVFPYIAMERLWGVDLASHLRDAARLSLAELLCLVEQLALGLDAAHRARVVHRDLKPNNVFRERTTLGDPCWKILDFGVSKCLAPSLDPTITATGWIGTPQYMAPEQIGGDGQLDHRVDLYALCAIAYRALTGAAPFSGAMPGILRSISERMPTAPSLHAPMHPDMDLVLAIGLAKEAEHRFQSARELADAFALAAQGALPQRLRIHAQHLLRAYPYATCA